MINLLNLIIRFANAFNTVGVLYRWAAWEKTNLLMGVDAY